MIDSTSCSTQNEYIGVNAFNVVIMLTVNDAVISDLYYAILSAIATTASLC